MGNKIVVLVLVSAMLALYLVFEHHLKDLLYARLEEAHSTEYVRRHRIVLKVCCILMLLFVVATLFWPDFPAVAGFIGIGVCVFALSVWAMRGGWRW